MNGTLHQPIHASVFLLLGGAVWTTLAAPPVIGTATSRGEFFLDSSILRGNATLLEGSVLETHVTPSVLRLRAGPRVTIGSSSRGRVYGDHLVLEKGEGSFEGSQQYRIDANSLRVVPESRGTTTRVVHGQRGKVTVVALSGALRVTTAGGVLLAKLENGMAREFEPQAAGVTAPLSVTGCLTAADTSFILKEETANLIFELRASIELTHYAGQRVAVTADPVREAKPAVPGAQVIRVIRLEVLGGGCAARTATGSPPAKSAGISGTTKAVIAGVAIAAAAGGAAVGLTGDDNSPSTMSR